MTKSFFVTLQKINDLTNYNQIVNISLPQTGRRCLYSPIPGYCWGLVTSELLQVTYFVFHGQVSVKMFTAGGIHQEKLRHEGSNTSKSTTPSRHCRFLNSYEPYFVHFRKCSITANFFRKKSGKSRKYVGDDTVFVMRKYLANANGRMHQKFLAT